MAGLLHRLNRPAATAWPISEPHGRGSRFSNPPDSPLRLLMPDSIAPRRPDGPKPIFENPGPVSRYPTKTFVRMDAMTARYPWIIAYDIACDRRRSRLARVLQGYGQRVNRSVFLCHLDEKRRLRLETDIRRLGLAASDDVRVYRIQRAGSGEGGLSEAHDLSIPSWNRV